VCLALFISMENRKNDVKNLMNHAELGSSRNSGSIADFAAAH
jgi:hypothetical protein